ncbi:T9SS type A sorting domain-containing protein [Hymenobacter edaphi]|uniref:Secretion system C-terminal sorting domain-containing protein n=1 Tax=Hymenobacter edaphi TaxID=2211146 RepID=A0A328BMP2_9BACT|nr:T9SS type A sorting domain-containing protein [Hymenobacter edaphi]RAK67955.1 hypothetical protein DLM85_07885 [Hymenobacter edaphi]
MRHPLRFNLNNLLAALLCLLASAARAQTPDWQTAVALAGDVQVQATAADAAGNVYLAGGFAGTVVLGSTTLNTPNGQELFVAKWNPNSGFAWALKGTSTTTTGRNLATAIALSGTNVYVAGNFVSQSLTLGTRPALINAQAGNSDIFLMRLIETGNTVSVNWAKRAGGTANDYANALSNFATTYLYLGGTSGGSATFDNYTLPDAGGFVARYYPVNLTMPASPAPVVPAGEEVTALQYLNGAVYAAGIFSNAANTMPGGPLASAGGRDAFVLKLDYLNLTTQLWAQQAGGPGDDYARSLLAAGSSVYVGGSYRSSSAAFGSTTLTNSGVANLFVSKLTDAGSSASFAWALQNGGTSTDASNSINGLGLYGTSLYAAGTFGGTASFGSRTLTSAGSSDVLVAKVADAGSTGSFVGAQQAGGTGADYASSVGRLDTRTWYAAGQVTTPAAFGTGFSIGTNAGVRPGYVATLSDPAPLLTLAAPNAGLTGSTVTLYGQGLTGTTAVAFSGSANNVVTSGFTVNASGTQISGVVVPAGAQSGPVNVTTASGTSNGLVSYTVLTANNSAPAWQRASTANTASLVRWAAPMANGSVVVAGEFSGSLTLGSTTLTSAGGTDVFVAKFDPATATYSWAVRAGGTSTDDTYGGLVVSGNNIYVAGQFYTQTATFGGTTLTAGQSFLNGYVAKLTDAGTSGSFTWAQMLDDGSGVYVEALAASGNNVYVGGDFLGAALTIGNQTLGVNNSLDDGYVARLTDNGSTSTCNWIKGIGNANASNLSTVNVYGLSVSGSTVYVSGVLYGNVTFGSTTVSAAGGANGPGDVAVARLIDNGTSASFTGAIRAGGTGSEFVFGLTAGPGGTLYVAGRNGSAAAWTGATVAGTGLGFVAKVIDTGGNLSFGWVQLLNSTVYQTAVNGTGLYAATSLAGTETYAGTPLRSAGSSDGLVLRLDDNGSTASVRWARAAGGLGPDSFRALALDAGGQVVVGGSVTPLAGFGSLVVSSPEGVAVAALGVLSDPLLLATTPGRSRAALALYPNPARTHVILHRPAAGAQPVLLDALGRAVRHYPAVSGKAETTLDLRGLPAGVYVLRCGPASQRLIVE